MAEFSINMSSGEPLIITEGFPLTNHVHQIPGARSLHTSGKFGQMLFQHVEGKGFDIWYSFYRINQRIQFFGHSDDPLVEFHCHYTNNFSTGWEGIGALEMQHRQYQVSFVPSVETTGVFPTGTQYSTFDIHFSRLLLEFYAPFCKRLGLFLEKVDGNKSSSFLDESLFLNPGMEQAVKDILNYSMDEQLAGDYFKRKVEDLLVHMIYHVGTLDKAPVFDPGDLRKAEEVRKIILSDFSVYDTVEVLAKKVHINEAKLQLAFKHLFGITVGKFSKDERMRKAHDLLLYSNEILLAIALMVGYNDAGNFSTAFKNHFGYYPGHVQKRMKK